MKFLIVVSALLVAALADDPHGIKSVFEKCQNNPETHVETSVLQQYHKSHGKSEAPANYDKHLLCVAKGLSLVNEDGKVNVEGVKTHVGHVVQEAEKVQTIVKECAVDQATPEETAHQLWKCLHQKHVFGRHGGSSEENSSESEEHHGHGHNHAHH